jgi:hypothetical protein
VCGSWRPGRAGDLLLKANCSAIAGQLPLLATSFSKRTALPLLVHCLEAIYSASQSKLFCHCWSIAIAGDQLLEANCSAIAGPLPGGHLFSFSKQTVLPLLVHCHCWRPASQSKLFCHCWSIAWRPSIQLLKANCSAIAGPLLLLATSFSKQTVLPLLVRCLEAIYSASQSKLFCHCWSIAIAGDQLLKANCSAIAGPLPGGNLFRVLCAGFCPAASAVLAPT